jgi:tetratricopeptide (TPR) repeat protein
MKYDDSVEALLQQGHDKLDREQYQAALEIFQQAAARVPANAPALYGLGLACYRLQRYGDAVEHLTEALRIKEEYPLALVRRGLAYKALNENVLARADFERAIEIPAGDFEDWRGRGSALDDLGRYEEAIASYDRAIEIKPDSHYAWGYRGIALGNLGRYEEAIASYDRAIEIKPDKHDAWYSRGIALDDLGRYSEAIASYDRAIEIKPDKHQAWVNRGVALRNSGRYSEAIASYDRAIEIKPDYHYAWNGRGIVLCDCLRRYEDAIALFDRAIEFKPDDHYAWYNRGVALGNLGRYSEAIASYDRAIEIKPDKHQAWVNRGVALRNLGRYSEAIASCDRAIEFKRDNLEPWILRGATFDQLKRYSEAIASYDRAIEIKPDSHEAWLLRGDTFDQLKRYSEAIASYDKAIEFKPDFHEAWNNRGIALAYLGRYEEAIDSYDRAMEIKPDSHEAWNNRGEALRKLGRYSEAIASYDEALRLTGNQFWQAWQNRGIALLNSRGYDAAIRTWTDGIKALQPEYAEYHLGMGELHRKKGSEQYRHGKRLLNSTNIITGPAPRAPKIGPGKDTRRTLEQLNPFRHWQQARKSYEAALTFLTFEKFPEPHLEILQDLIKVCSDLGDAKAVENLLEKGAQLLDELRRTCEFDTQKISLSRKFAPFEQLRVDIRAESGDRNKQIEALELAEKRKNTCLAWMRYGWNFQFPSPNYQQMRQLLNPQTAIIYWHVSSAALTTFILRYDKKDPITHTLKPVTEKKSFGVFSQPVAHEHKAHLPAIRQLEDFERWVADWKRDYQEYRKISPKSSQKETHPWRVKMEERLNELAGILKIETLLTHLTGITQLILIPHRDLHLLPLEYLFRGKRFTLTRLPSAQVGIQLAKSGNAGEFSLLNVEQVGNPPLQFVHIESSVISLLYPNHQRLGENATPAQVIERLQKDAGAFNFTGHGEHNLDSPLESALIFNCGELLTLRDIFALENLPNCKLVCLSACETGITSTQTLVDEYVGLVSGFLAVGATHVASTLWQVDSQATALMLIQFYRNLRKNKSAAHLPDEEPHPPTPSPRAGRGSKREFSMSEKSVSHSSPAPPQNNAVPAIALQQAQEWLRTATYDILGKWYRDVASEFQERHQRAIQRFLETQATRQKELAIIEPNKRPYEHPYYWAAFTGTGIL